MSHMDKLKSIRKQAGKSETPGLPDAVLETFLTKDPNLGIAIDRAAEEFTKLTQEFGDLVQLDEKAQIERIQAQFVNFYTEDTVNPYVSLAAKGPWLITNCGAVIHDSGGYGMLGLGHAPDEVLSALGRPHVMANIMTANFAQARLVQKLNREIGFSREEPPFAKFLCLNSGSEAVSIAARISDINAKQLTQTGGRHAGKKIKFLAFSGGFHGRTDRPAQASDSTLKKYRNALASFSERSNLVTIAPNDVSALQKAFAQAEREGVFFEAMFIEPVMGEGNPGVAVTPEFYQVARELTAKNQTLLLVDAIQASLRAQGCLSICDYPGFEQLDSPDMETYSKALNAGQFPLSVLALRQPVAELYVKGIYGNTMTTNPKAIDVACAVLDAITPEVRKNIQDRGKEFVKKLRHLQEEFPRDIVGVTGTGLLFACHMDPERRPVVGFGALEEQMRRRGIGVIHGGANALRFTPHFRITSGEIDLVIQVLRDILTEK